MGIIRKIKDNFINPEKPSLISRGNSFEVNTQLELQKEIDLATAAANETTKNLDTISTALKTINKKYIANKIITEYVLLDYQAKYFCGTCKFETENWFIKSLIINVIRGSFMFGCAGIYVNDNIPQPVYIQNIKRNTNGEIVSAEIFELSVMLTKMSELNFNWEEYKSKLMFKTIDKEAAKNLAVFTWGTVGFSAWYTIYPFVKYQHSLLKMIITQTYSFTKRYDYRVKNSIASAKELELFFDEDNPFIITIGEAGDLDNKFRGVELPTGLATDLIDFYNKVIGIYYHIYGRRINNDIKKERNIGAEVEASQENYSIIQSDWLNQFEIFIKHLNELIPTAKISIPKDDYLISEDMNTEEVNNE